MINEKTQNILNAESYDLLNKSVKLLDETIKELEKTLDEEGLYLFKCSQMAFNAFAYENSRFMASKYFGGSIYQMGLNITHKYLIDHRIGELRVFMEKNK